MKLPELVLQHELTVEPPTGQGARGTVYGPPVTVRCWVVWKRGRARDSQGQSVTTAAQVLAGIGDELVLVAGARVTHPRTGWTGWVVEATPWRGNGLPGPDHVVAALA